MGHFKTTWKDTKTKYFAELHASHVILSRTNFI